MSRTSSSAPTAHDAHQDHRTLAKLVPTVFRDHLTLGYEILKWESDLAQPTVFLPLAEPVMREKVAKLHEHYGSQRDRTWFDAEDVLGPRPRAGCAVSRPVRRGVPRRQDGARGGPAAGPRSDRLAEE